MKSSQRSLPVRLFDRLTLVFAGIALLVGVLALLGWLFDITPLKAGLPGLHPMKINTSFGIALSAISLGATQIKGGHSKIISIACASFALLLGLLTLLEYFSAINFGIDRLLFRQITHLPTDILSRMSFNSALSLSALSAALLLLSENKWRRAIYALAIVPIFGAGTVLIGYAFDIKAFLLVKHSYEPMAVNSAVAFILLALGVVNARPEYPFRRLMTSDNAAGVTSRRLLPGAIGLPLIIGWLTHCACQGDYLDEIFALALFTVANIAAFSILILWNTGKLHEEKIRYLAAIVESSDDAIVGKSLDGIITSWNKGAEKMYGYSPNQAIGQSVSILIPFERKDELRRILELINKGQSVEHFETVRRKNNGEQINVSLSVFPISQASDIVGAASVARDITARKRTEDELCKHQEHLEELIRERTEQLETANKDLEGFSYSVSHDLRVPLRAIDGFSHQLQKLCADKLDDEGQRYLNIVRDNTKKMSQLIDDILAFSRMGRLGMTMSEIDMLKLAQNVFEDLKPSLAERECNIEFKPLPFCHGDLSMMRQVWINLLSNAIKFTQNKTIARIELGGYIENDENIYYVKDNGAGFDMQYADKLFGVFQRLHGIEEFDGTGIGLAIVKRIVTRHGGRVWAKGKVNEGATFYFAVPVLEENR